MSHKNDIDMNMNMNEQKREQERETLKKTIFAPYHYIWASENESYTVKTLKEGIEKMSLKAATAAFVVGNGHGGLWDMVHSSIPDMKHFVDNGGHLIISCGGAKGPFLEEHIGEDQQYRLLKKLLQDTGCRALDFDVEGVSIGMVKQISQRNKVIKRLQEAYPDLYISYTLGITRPGPSHGVPVLPQAALELLKNAKKEGCKINVVNAMLMDLYGPMDKSWGCLSVDILERVKSQLATIYTSKSSEELYNMLGATFMIGQNDDRSIFTLDDAKHLVEYVKEKKLGLLSYWALQRDQEKKVSRGISSMIDQKDFDFYNICKSVAIDMSEDMSEDVPEDEISTRMDEQDVIPEEKKDVPSKIDEIIIPVPKPVPVPKPKPQTIGNEWRIGVSYKTGDLVHFQGKMYRCSITHGAVEAWAPDSAPAVWQNLGLIPPSPEPATPPPAPQPIPKPIPKPVPIYPKYVQVPIPRITKGKVVKQIKMDVTIIFSNDGHYSTAVTSSTATYDDKGLNSL